MLVYVVRGYHKINNKSYIVGIYNTEEKAHTTVTNCFDADIDSIYSFAYEVFFLS